MISLFCTTKTRFLFVSDKGDIEAWSVSKQAKVLGRSSIPYTTCSCELHSSSKS